MNIQADPENNKAALVEIKRRRPNECDTRLMEFTVMPGCVQSFIGSQYAPLVAGGSHGTLVIKSSQPVHVYL